MERGASPTIKPDCGEQGTSHAAAASCVQVYKALLRAQEAVIAALRPGARLADVYQVRPPLLDHAVCSFVTSCTASCPPCLCFVRYKSVRCASVYSLPAVVRVQAGVAVVQADAPDAVPFLSKTFGSSIGEWCIASAARSSVSPQQRQSGPEYRPL